MFELSELFSAEMLLALGATVARVIAVLLIGIIVRRLAMHLADGIMKARFGRAVIAEKRVETLRVLLTSILRYAIDFIIILTILQLLGVQITSLLAAAGILGLAVGFGAQNLVRDLIGGFFIIFEDQFSVSDYVSTAGHSGIVEDIGLRTVKLRDFSGDLHIIPNGQVEKVTNHSRGAMRVLVQVDVAYEEDLDNVFEILQATCDQASDEVDHIIEGPAVLGVQDFGDSGITILVWARTEPMQQWATGRELRLRIKKAFDAAGVEIPYPRRVVVPANMTKVKPDSHDNGEELNK